MKKEKHNQKVTEVGRLIPKASFKSLQNNYKRTFPGTSCSFIMSKRLVHQALELSEKVVGIRFMFGLEDELNPNSIRLLLVPCIERFNDQPGVAPMVNDAGFLDHLGQRHSVYSASEMVAHFVQSCIQRDKNQSYKAVTRGSYFGKNRLLDIMSDPACHHVLFHFGMKEKVIKPVLEPINNHLESYTSKYLDYGQACPPFCEEGMEKSCIAKFAFSAFEIEEDLSIIHHFKDKILIDLENGPKYYEMFYFIYPFLRAVVNAQEDKEEVLSNIYFSIIKPIKALLYANQYEEALALFKSEISLLIRDYESELVAS